MDNQNVEGIPSSDPNKIDPEQFEAAAKKLDKLVRQDLSLAGTLRALYDKYWDRVGTLESRLKSTPDDQVARQELRSLLLTAYQRDMREGTPGSVFNAMQKAEHMVRAGIADGEVLLELALRESYDKEIEREAYGNALQRVEALRRFGVSDADGLAQKVERLLVEKRKRG